MSKLVMLGPRLPGHGTSSQKVVCGECGEMFFIYIWSFNGSGKKCPGCGSFYGVRDLVSEETAKMVKRDGKFGFLIAGSVYMFNNALGWRRTLRRETDVVV